MESPERTTPLFVQPILDIYALFHDMGANQWPKRFDADAHKGVAGVTAVEVIAIIASMLWLQPRLGIGYHAGRLLVLCGSIILFALNYYVLCVRELGRRFQSENHQLPPAARMNVHLRALAYVIVVGLAAWWSIEKYRSLSIPLPS